MTVSQRRLTRRLGALVRNSVPDRDEGLVDDRVLDVRGVGGSAPDRRLVGLFVEDFESRGRVLHPGVQI